MGNLLKVLTYNELDQGPNFFLDFENAQPTEAETAVWNQVNAVLEEAQTILAELQSYTGAGQEIREVGAAPLPAARTPTVAWGQALALSPSQAIQNPGDLRLQERAWSAVCPLVAKLKRFYEFSLRLENALRSLLEALTSPPYAPTQHLEREQALAKQFAEILHFTLSFDELKMTNPAIQNDFSYYRRTISRNRINNLQLDAESEVNNEMANRMSLFYAEATPMLKTLSNATTKFVSENKTLPIEDTTDCLSTMACVCRVMLETPEYRSRFTNTETLLFCMRVMVGVIILYDHVHPVGAFAKTSKIDMKGCIKVLKDQPSTSTEGLLNALRYTTRHLNDDTTSKQIRALLQ
ncbi:FA49A protein, partial [Chloropsis hardwickii]|nr:FA49A protein [Chloropsis hardwickii]